MLWSKFGRNYKSVTYISVKLYVTEWSFPIGTNPVLRNFKIAVFILTQNIENNGH